MRALFLSVVPIAALLSGCRPDDFARPAVATNATRQNTCCNPDGDFPHLAGTFFVQTFQGQLMAFEEDSIDAVMTYEFDRVDPLRMNRLVERNIFGDPVLEPFASGDSFDLGSVEFGISAEACEYGDVRCDIRIEIVGRRKDDGRLDVIRLERTFRVVNDCVLRPVDPGDIDISLSRALTGSDASWIVEAIHGRPMFAFDLLEEDAPAGVPTRHPDARVVARIPSANFAETVRHGALVVDLDAADIERVFTGAAAPFAVGGSAADHYLPVPTAVHAVEAELSMQPGTYALCWQVLDGEIPGRLTGNDDLEYGLFLDHTQDPADGFVASAPFVFDPRGGASRWLTLRHAGGDRWRAVVHQLDGDGAAREVPSAARVIVTDRVVFWVVPVDEFSASTTLFVRHGTFWHRGDFGQLGGDWAADCTPAQDGPAYFIPLGGEASDRPVRVSPR